MMKRPFRSAVVLLVLLALLGGVLAGCGGSKSTPPAEQPAASEPAQQEPAASEPAKQEYTTEGKILYWVQPLKGHPVHQLTQIAFLEGCKELDYQCEVIGTEQWDVQGTIALVESAMSRGAAAMAVWAGDPSFYPFIEKVSQQGVKVFVPHFPIPEGDVPGLTGIIGADPRDYAKEVAMQMGQAIGGKGTVAITQGSFNTTENLVSEVFTQTMNANFPDVKVLAPQEEGFDPPKAIAKAVAILQGNPDVVAALSTTGGGPTTWAGAQKETGRKLYAVGMDYTRVNLDLVKNDEVSAVVGQPLYEESHDVVALMDKVLRGGSVGYWTKLTAPYITKDGLAPYEAMLDKVEAAIK